MDAKIKKLWVDALRSGEFKQAVGALRVDDGFCCLGVLCEVHRRTCGGEWDEWGWYRGADDTLPEAVVRWAELRSSDPTVEIEPDEDGNDHDDLATLNDTGWTFEDIAERIEASL